VDATLCESAFGLVGAGTRWIDAEPSRVALGVLRQHGWHVSPVKPTAGFDDHDLYLVKINAELHQEPAVPTPRWFEVGYAFSTADGRPTVVDALPRTVLEPQPASSYQLDAGLAFVPAAAETGTVHLLACGPVVDVFGIYGPQIRWRYSGSAVRLGSWVSWLVLAVPSGAPEVVVEVSLRHDLAPDDALGMLPAADTGRFTLRLDRSGEPATPTTSTPTVRLTGAKAPRVFISYTHDSPTHMERVRQLAEFLCQCGIDTHMDRWNLDERRNWNQWALHNLRAADFVLVIASPLCRAVGNGEVDNKMNRGMQSELVVLADQQHTDRETWTRKILPVVLPPHTPDDLPAFLLPRSADHYKVPTPTREGAEYLLRTITRQPRFTRPQVATELITFD
jgi:hypothetical protein